MKKFFTDKEGNVVIGQRPNLPILVWAGTALLSMVPLLESVREVLSLVSFGALFTWAWLELFQGVCPFRRVLGAVVMVLAIWFAL